MRTTRRQSLTLLATLPGLLALTASAQGVSEPPAEVSAALTGAK